MTTAPAVLSARILPRTRLNTVALVIGFALLTALFAQIRIQPPGWPVPITGQTFAVLLSGGVLGMWAGASSQALYVVLGVAGLPFFAGGERGWEYAVGATGGYLIGFVFAAAFVGYMAEKRQDRKFSTSIGTFLTGNLIIYAFGLPWLMRVLEMSFLDAVAVGMAPFIIGDVIKAILAAGLMPAAWRALGESR